MKKIKRSHLAIIAVFIIIVTSFMVYGLLFSKENSSEKTTDPKLPYVSIGCDRVVWSGTELEFKPSIKNIKDPKFQWFLNNKSIGSNKKLLQTFDSEKSKISLKTSFDDQIIEKNISIITIDSAEGISLSDFQDSKNQWKFQTLYKGANAGVDGVIIYIDSSIKKSVNTCGYVSVPLMAGGHTWKAEYNGNIIVSGNFSLKKVDGMKIERISIKSSYRIGDTVDGKIILKNIGTTIMKNFDVKISVINHKFELMGDAAKKEYYDKYDPQLKPGEQFEIQMQIKIPEKVSGVEPTGKYTIVVDLILNNKTIDKKTIDTEVKS